MFLSLIVYNIFVIYARFFSYKYFNSYRVLIISHFFFYILFIGTYNLIIDSKARVIISLKFFSLSSLVNFSFVVNESLIVSKHEAFLFKLISFN
jgi:hypothetical protein